ncbi:hypothetical protein ACFLX3_01850 [Chloroflexota bacterium]
MKQRVNIGIIGDYDQNLPPHQATNEALVHAAGRLSTRVNVTWLPTTSLITEDGQQNLKQSDAVWAAPGSYQSPEGALIGIRLARDMNLPFIGT